MLRRFAVLLAFAGALGVATQADAGCRHGRRRVADCRPHDRLVWHPELGAYTYWGWGACWNWDFRKGGWVYICY
ncbi:hypothetical protein [Methylocystis heyeri]|uniref:Uncharacterized protein n=1 Tax=Methylocystis heyeri TaxID=391905 RepID=A0A6B8KGR2_9HYPH|nr:hypothetical protein [Methylocystis heyeri]QGM45620.1 hypothetical protein H2LOC_007855 [Methylocystis heyeri]